MYLNLCQTTATRPCNGQGKLWLYFIFANIFSRMIGLYMTKHDALIREVEFSDPHRSKKTVARRRVYAAEGSHLSSHGGSTWPAFCWVLHQMAGPQQAEVSQSPLEQNLLHLFPVVVSF